MSVEVVALDAERARALTEEVKADVHSLWAKVLALYEGSAHVALGYESWEGYWEAEFGQTGSRGRQLVRAGRVLRALESVTPDAPMPASDFVARELVPVFRTAPEDLGDVWQRVLEVSNGNPTRAIVTQVVEPYRRRRNLNHDPAAAGKTRKRRNLAGVPIIQAHANAAGALANIDDALDAEPAPEILREWLEHVEATEAIMAGLGQKLREHLSTHDRA